MHVGILNYWALRALREVFKKTIESLTAGTYLGHIWDISEKFLKHVWDMSETSLRRILGMN